MGVSDVYNVRLEMTNTDNGTIANMIWQFIQQSGSGQDASNFAPNFESITLAVAACMHEDAYVSGLEIVNLFDPVDFINQAFPSSQYPGTWDSDGSHLPDFVAAPFRANRGRTDMRSGQKRVPFLAENATFGNVFTPAFETVGNTLAVAMDAGIDSVGGGHWESIIVKRIPYTTTGGNTAYRLPENPGELIQYEADWVFVNRVSSQVSRKYYG